MTKSKLCGIAETEVFPSTMPFLMHNQQQQSTDGVAKNTDYYHNNCVSHTENSTHKCTSATSRDQEHQKLPLDVQGLQ